MHIKSHPFIRIFSGDKTVSPVLLNRLGVQVLRMVAARAIHRMMPAFVDKGVEPYVKEVRREGIAMIHDFLPPDAFEKVRKEYARIADNADSWKILIRGSNTQRLAFINSLDPSMIRNASTYFFENPIIHAIFSALEKSSLRDLRVTKAFEELTHGSDETKDPEAKFHSDIFFNTHKAWLYLDDVTLEHGPLAYVKRSHLLNARQLAAVYKDSCKENEGSRRIPAEEIAHRGLAESFCVCPKNTLLVANTFGYHRRVQGNAGMRRVALQISVRAPSPFQLLFRSSGSVKDIPPLTMEM